MMTFCYSNELGVLHTRTGGDLTTVVATLFEQNARFKNYHFRLFNSEKAALHWLNVV